MKVPAVDHARVLRGEGAVVDVEEQRVFDAHVVRRRAAVLRHLEDLEGVVRRAVVHHEETAVLERAGGREAMRREVIGPAMQRELARLAVGPQDHRGGEADAGGRGKLGAEGLAHRHAEGKLEVRVIAGDGDEAPVREVGKVLEALSRGLCPGAFKLTRHVVTIDSVLHVL